MNLKHTFGKNIKYYRFQMKYTQAELAEKVNLSPTYLGEVERGLHSVDFSKIEMLSKCLNVESFQLFLPAKNINLPRRIDMSNKL